MNKPICFLVLLVLSWLNLSAKVEQLTVETVAVYPHDAANFTQGLICEENTLIESTGLYGSSCLKKTELTTGNVLKEIQLAEDCFGEGIARVGNRLIQLTWKEKKALIYDVNTFELIGEFPYNGEGWGLCQDGENFWMSNGSPYLSLRNGKNFEVLKTITVREEGKSIPFLNDLICVGDHLYANIWGHQLILKIDKNSGEVTSTIDAACLNPWKKKHPEAVMNGIAYRPETQTFLLTGKYWPSLYEVRFIPKVK